MRPAQQVNWFTRDPGGTTAYALGPCTVRWYPNACTLAHGHTGAHRAADGSALVATHGSGDLEPTGQPEALGGH